MVGKAVSWNAGISQGAGPHKNEKSNKPGKRRNKGRRTKYDGKDDGDFSIMDALYCHRYARWHLHVKNFMSRVVGLEQKSLPKVLEHG